MEGLVTAVTQGSLFGGIYAGRRVFVTGHTGFKGSWLVYWLLAMGAEVTGYALEPPTTPALFDALGLEQRMDHHIGDVRDLSHLRQVMEASRPEIVMHLAAQPLVRLSYDEPVDTFATNVMGSVNVLEAVRSVSSVKAVLNVTSDKCYENREWEFAYRENDAMGGYDPYSASKGCAELVTASYRQSFFGAESPVSLASARAGNVIGGGDWALDRIVPDCVRALAQGEPVVVRNPDAVRPWQHVLEPVGGYLWLASRLFAEAHAYDGSWNFGPAPAGNLTVREVVETVLSEWGSGKWTGPSAGARNPHEAHFLKLDCSKAADLLAWRPVWDAETALRATTAWYRDYYGDATQAERITAECIDAYVTRACESCESWAR